MSLFVISDLHIWGPQDPLYLCLIALISDRAAPGDTVVLAGDLFDLFVGNKKVFAEKYFRFFKEMEAAGKRGVHLHYIEGNHDFLFRRAFRNMAGVRIHGRDFGTEIQGKRFFFAHGDLVDGQDYSYLLLRNFFRSPLMSLFVTLAPGEWLEKFGRYWSHKSRTTKPLLPSELPVERRFHLRKIYRNFAAERILEGYDFVVMGHCHDLDEMTFKIDSRQGQYVNVGFPRIHGSFLSWTPGQEKISREKLPNWAF